MNGYQPKAKGTLGKPPNKGSNVCPAPDRWGVIATIGENNFPLT